MTLIGTCAASSEDVRRRSSSTTCAASSVSVECMEAIHLIWKASRAHFFFLWPGEVHHNTGRERDRLDANLGFNDGYQSISNNLFSNLELLFNKLFDSSTIRTMDDASHFGTENIVCDCIIAHLVEVGNRLH